MSVPGRPSYTHFSSIRPETALVARHLSLASLARPPLASALAVVGPALVRRVSGPRLHPTHRGHLDILRAHGRAVVACPRRSRTRVATSPVQGTHDPGHHRLCLAHLRRRLGMDALGGHVVRERHPMAGETGVCRGQKLGLRRRRSIPGPVSEGECQCFLQHYQPGKGRRPRGEGICALDRRTVWRRRRRRQRQRQPQRARYRIQQCGWRWLREGSTHGGGVPQRCRLAGRARC